jgi:endonuclease/exonuclease/phosphatase family metal-dependent hydrolase
MKSQMVEQLNECDGWDEVAQVEADIQGRLRHYVRDFRMIVQDGGLVLYGHTRTYYGKQLVQHGVMARSQLPIRANNIDVL